MALAIRLLYVFWITSRYGVIQFSDALYMHDLAVSLANDRGFTVHGVRIFNQSWGYPLFLSLFYRLFGANEITAFVINSLLGALAAGLVCWLSLLLFGHDADDSQGGAGAGNRCKTIALLAGFIAAVYPDGLMYTAMVLSENLLVPAMLLMVLLTFRPSKSDLIAGVAMGSVAAIAASVKAYILPFCLFIPLLWYLLDRRFMLRTVTCIIVVVLWLIPWTVLNYRASGRFIPFAVVAGEVLLDGTNPVAKGKPTNQYHLAPEVEAGKTQIELDRLRMRQAVAYMKADPKWFVVLSMKKAVFALSPARDFMFEYEGRPRLPTLFLSRWGTTSFNAMLLAGSVVGIWLLRRSQFNFILGIALFTTPILIQVLFCAFPRYRYPFLFCMLPFCAMSVVSISSLFSGSEGDSGVKRG
jgi:hypothetical protein